MVTWNVREYSGGRVWVGPGVPMPRGCVGVAVTRVVGGTGVGVAVAVGVSGVSVHPAKTVSRMMTEMTRIRENFFIPCSVTSLDIIIAKYCEGSSSFYPASLD